jgi:hypothetical protein
MTNDLHHSKAKGIFKLDVIMDRIVFLCVCVREIK